MIRAVVAAACMVSLGTLARAAEPVDYVRQVKPLLEARCSACHGADEQKSGLRLDAAALIRRGGDHGPAIVPGKAAESLIIQVLAEGGDVPRMPFEDDPLTKAEIDLLTRWVNEGAKAPADEQVANASNVRSDHWSFQPVVRPELPQVKRQGWVRNPVDAFILAQLEAHGLQPSPEADRTTLIRRLSLDLRGLPPTLAEIDAFVADEHPDAYERLVDRLLRTPQYGECWARHWLDVARYADSNGYTIDGPRSIWKYRDWVIDAVNRDMPFDEFVIEQMAGDMLPHATQAQIVATGFHRNTLINQEGGTDQEQFRVEAVVDRVNTTGAAFLGLTVGCARCHEHKFDPISQRDFYQLFAFLNNADEPSIPVPSAEQAKRQNELQAALSAARKKLSAFDAKADERREAWEKRLAALPLDVQWSVLDAQDFSSAGGATLTELDDRSLLAGGKIPESDTYTVTLPLPLQGVTAVRIEALTHESLPKGGPGLAANGNFVLTDFQVGRRTLGEPDTVHPVKLVKATAEHSQQRFPVEDALDDDPEKSGWAINVASGSLNVDRSAVFIFDKPLAPEDTRLTLTLRHAHPNRYSIGRLRISATSAPAEVLALPADIRAALATPAEKRTPEQHQALAVELRRQEPERAPLQDSVNDLTKQLADFKKTIATTMVMRERAKPRETHIHIRGDFLRPGARVEPGVPAVLPPLPAGIEKPNRLDLARWLVDPANPLTPRVTMNRVWQQLFGRGIVTTENDFGTQGELPTHPKLLDWLADELIHRGWSRKQMLRLLVNSATYRQSSRVSPEQLAADPYNKWLGRQSRLRLEAETIRDVALAASGLLSDKIGGPGVFPPQPKGIYRFTQNQKNWRADTGEDRYRRGMYTYFWRSSPDPFLMTFDAPNANVTCTRRIRSNTPLQALTIANDGAFVEIAQGLAARVLRESPSPGTGQRLRHAFRLCLSREPGDWEAERLTAYLEGQLAHFNAAPEQARKVAPARLPAGVGPAEGAAWTSVARVLLNLDEMITRE